ncbi:MAG: pyridoxal phosphate-dependent decarboxylase family protein, partial [Acidimicrobiales bacterium]
MGHRPGERTDSSNTDRINTDSDDKAALVARAADLADSYITAERSRRVSPRSGALDRLGAAVDAITLDEPMRPVDALELVAEIGDIGAVRSTGGRYFGFVNGGVAPAALAASIVAAPWDQNVGLPVMSPAASLLDEAAARLVFDVLGLPTGTVASFCAGATIANITAVVTARDSLLRRAGWDPTTDGLRGAPPIRVVASAEIHVSVLKALRIAGFGRNDVQLIPTDGAGRLIATELPAHRGGPTLVALQAGNVNTGGSDPFGEVIDRLGGEETWVHVDGAFGLWAAASPAKKGLLAGVERADSWATDAHKWLNAPYDCGVVLCRHPRELATAMAMQAAYVPADGADRA